MKFGIAVKNSHFYPSKCFICEWCRSVCNNASHAARRGAPTPARICTCTLRRCYPIIIQWDLFYLSVIQSLFTRGNSFFCFVSDKTKNIGNTVCCYFFCCTNAHVALANCRAPPAQCKCTACAVFWCKPWLLRAWLPLLEDLC